VTYRTDSAETLHDNWGFPVQPTLNEAFKTPEFNDMHPCLIDFTLLIEPDGDLCVTFDSRNRIDYNLAGF
jgi:hypothetical protein